MDLHHHWTYNLETYTEPAFRNKPTMKGPTMNMHLVKTNTANMTAKTPYSSLVDGLDLPRWRVKVFIGGISNHSQGMLGIKEGSILFWRSNQIPPPFFIPNRRGKRFQRLSPLVWEDLRDHLHSGQYN